MNILHIQYDVVWSWTEVAKQLHKQLPEHNFIVIPTNTKTLPGGYDVILTQQALMLEDIQDKQKAITRIGTNSIFDGRYKVERILNNIKQCFAVIATNNYLYETVKKINPNTYLIPNGLDLQEWKPNKRVGRHKFIAGFCANITTPEYRDYKGFDYVDAACKNLGVELKLALYKNGQIPHEKMREEFYYKISCLVHPTKGEGCSNSIMEALACGVPVITTKEAGFHGEMLEDGKNVLFCERTVESVEKCIKALKEDRSLRSKLRIEGRKFAEKYHDVKEIAEKYREVIEKCYEANQKIKKEENKQKNKMVTVRLKRSIYEAEEGFLERGTVIDMSEYRVKQLGDELVEVIENVEARAV